MIAPLRRLAHLIIVMAWLLPVPAFGQTLPADCEPDETASPAKFDTVKMYPSLTPRSFVRAEYGMLLEPPNPDEFDAGVNTTWLLVEKGSRSGIHPTRVDVDTARASYVAYLFFDPHIVSDQRKEYELFIITRRKHPTTGTVARLCTKYAGTIKFDRPDPYTLKLSPTFAPDAELTDGKKKAAGRFGVTLDVPSLVPNPWANAFFKFDGLFSTEPEDKATKVEAKLGLDRSLLVSWYVPAHLDVKYIGDQRGENQSAVASAGVQTLVPWGWTRSFLWNVLLKAPGSPLFGLSSEWQEVLREKAVHSSKSQFRLLADVHWAPIYLLVKGDTPTAKDISLEITGKLWWFPDEKRRDGNFKDPVEHRLDVSLIVPTAFISQSQVAAGFLAGLIGEGFWNGSARIVVKYSTGANEANGFRNSGDLSVNLEYLK